MSQIRNCLVTNLVAGSLASVALLQVPAAVAGTERVVYSFCSQQNCTDGAQTQAGVIDVGGLLYGTTWSGGANNEGTVFSVNPTTDAEMVVHAFQGYGNDGSHPQAGLINIRGILYGTTLVGGTGPGLSCCWGTVFSVNPVTGAEAVVYSFCSQGGSECTDGAQPYAGLKKMGGMLYGTTEFGGAESCRWPNNGCGTVFSLDPTTGAETVLHTFQDISTDGQDPYGRLINVGGVLFGTTPVGGGAADSGTVFSVDPNTGTETVVYAFCSGQQRCTDGQNPWAGLINVGGILYGTTGHGGTNYGSPGGTVFSINPTTGAETLVYSFCSLKNCADGDTPSGGLINVRGILYGTASGGGAKGCGGGGCGTVFSVNPGTGAETVVHAFQDNGADGQLPSAGLINVRGELYGTTKLGGANGQGTVFAITP